MFLPMMIAQVKVSLSSISRLWHTLSAAPPSGLLGPQHSSRPSTDPSAVRVVYKVGQKWKPL